MVTTPQSDEDPLVILLSPIVGGEYDDTDPVNTERKEDKPEVQSNDDEDQLQRLLQCEQGLRRKLEMRGVQRRIREPEASLDSDDGFALVNHRARNALVSSKRGVPDRTSSESDNGSDLTQRCPPILRALSLMRLIDLKYHVTHVMDLLLFQLCSGNFRGMSEAALYPDLVLRL